MKSLLPRSAPGNMSNSGLCLLGGYVLAAAMSLLRSERCQGNRSLPAFLYAVSEVRLHTGRSTHRALPVTGFSGNVKWVKIMVTAHRGQMSLTPPSTPANQTKENSPKYPTPCTRRCEPSSDERPDRRSQRACSADEPLILSPILQRDDIRYLKRQLPPPLDPSLPTTVMAIPFTPPPPKPLIARKT